MIWRGAVAAIGTGILTFCLTERVWEKVHALRRFARMTSPGPDKANGDRTGWWHHRSRKRRLSEQIESGLLLLAGLTRAGAQPAEAVAVAAAELPSPLRDELLTVNRQYEAGRSLADSLCEASQRIGMPLLSRLGAVFDLCQTAGSDPSPLVEGLADRVRDDSEFRRELGQRTSELRFTGKMLLVLPWGLLVLMLMVDRSSVMESIMHPGGRGVLLGAFLLWLVGGLWMLRIIDANSLLGE